MYANGYEDHEEREGVTEVDDVFAMKLLCSSLCASTRFAYPKRLREGGLSLTAQVLCQSGSSLH